MTATHPPTTDIIWDHLIDANQSCADPTLLSALQAQARHRTTASNAPRLIHLCGLPGSGKTTYATTLAGTHSDFWHLQFDHIMQSLPAYQEALQQAGPVTAFANWEKPAAHIGYRLLQMLIREKRNVLFDHSAAHPRHAELVLHCKHQGYQVEMHYLETPVDIVLDRVKAREPKIGRHTPPALIHERHQLLQDLLPVYRKTADRFIAVDNTMSHQTPLTTP